MRGFVLSSLNQHAFTAVTTYIALIVGYSFHPVTIHRLGKMVTCIMLFAPILCDVRHFCMYSLFFLQF